MKHISFIRSINIGLMLSVALATVALSHYQGFGAMPQGDDEDTVSFVGQYLPNEVIDTTVLNRDTATMEVHSHINVITRTYGDSIVLRWAGDDYATWRRLNRGINILRMDDQGKLDTLAYQLRPASLEMFRALYPETDSLAMMAMGSLYKESMLNKYPTREEPGSMGSLYEIYEDQQMTYGVAVLMSELRMDLANRMAMRFVDRNVKPGRKYDYFVHPSDVDSVEKFIIESAIIEGVENVNYTPQPFDIEIKDSITGPNSVLLKWESSGFSSFEIERRKKGATAWERCNDRPFINMIAEGTGSINFYGNMVEEPGTYEYRIMAHDPFGDLTSPSPVHTVEVPDLIGPSAPMISLINIIRPQEDLTAEIWAELHITKEVRESDFVGMVPMYFHERATNGEWKSLLPEGQMMAPTDTMVMVEVTNIPSCMVSIAAVDAAGNKTFSIPQLMRVTDVRAPKAPTGLKAKGSVEDGTITLTWNALDDEDISYYEVVYANDSTHTFLQKSLPGLRDTTFVDTISLDVNQKYIYYKVRAVDYSTNIGEFSEMLQVIRPSLVPPSVAHLDSAHVGTNGVFMRWIAGGEEQAAYHNVYRKLASREKTWTLIRTCDGDSVRLADYVIDVFDHPKENSFEEYSYAVESFNYSGISSGLSLVYSTIFRGDPVFSAPIQLLGDFDAERKLTKLAWEVTSAPEGKDWFFCIWRKGPGEDHFKFFISADPDERDYSDRLLLPGQEAQYYIQIQMEDGRESEPSNVVTIKAPVK